MRWLVGGLLAVVLIAGLVFAVTNLGSLFSSQPQANPTAAGTNSSAAQGSPAATQATPSAPPAVPPAIEGITRLGDFPFAATYDKDLARAFDGNAASYWSDMEFASANWGGLFEDMPLVVKLKRKPQRSSPLSSTSWVAPAAASASTPTIVQPWMAQNWWEPTASPHLN
jgi:hypothetical protein